MQDHITSDTPSAPVNFGATNNFFEALYSELRSMAQAQLRRNNHSKLNTTTLVHESYLRFLNNGEIRAEDRRHFLAYASHVMRSIVVDYSRRRMASRRGAGQQPITLNTDSIESITASDEQVIKVHESLEELAALDPRLAQIVEMRYFGGLKESEIAEALDISTRTVQRDWEKARLLLAISLQE